MAEADQQFDIVFRGDIVLGHQLDAVKARLGQLFKADSNRIEALFTGRPVPLKRNLDEATAKKYQAVLTKAGAEVSLVPAGAQDTPRAAPKRGFTLAPVGASLLRLTERRQLVPVEVDTSGLSLSAPEGPLVAPAEIAPAEVAPVAVPAFDLAPVGADVLSAGERAAPVTASVKVADWELSEVGEDLLSPAEQINPLPLIVADLEAELAPAGSDLGQIPDTRKPVNPDTSKLQLAD